MCLAMPGKIIEIVDPEKRIGRVDVFGSRRRVNLGMLDEVAPGDWVLINMGFAIEKIDEAQAAETRSLLEEMSAAFEEELAAAAGVAEP